MSDCCTVERPRETAASTRCPECDVPGRKLDPLTPKALLTPRALARLTPGEHRFCPSPHCPVAYFGSGDVFRREDLRVPVFQKEPEGERLVCYCFELSEADIRREIAESGQATASKRITAHVQAGRCACEVQNPQGSCCLGNVATVEKREARSQVPVSAEGASGRESDGVGAPG